VFLGTGLEAIASVLVLRALNGQIVLCTNGTVSDNTTRELAHRIGLTIYDERIVGVASRKGELVSLSLDSGVELPCGALFLRPQVRQACDLLLELGCIDAPEQPLVPSADTGQTRVPGLFVAGDARLPWHQIAIAIADGMKVGMAVHTELAFEPYGLRP
jgi:thioredoxin reductase